MPGHKSPTFNGQYFFSTSLTTCWSNTHFNGGLPEATLPGLLLIPANLQQLNQSSQEKLIQHYSLICRNQAVRRRSWSCESASGILFMGCQVNSESVITLKKNWLYLVLKYVLILAFIFRNNAAVKPTTLQETLKACSSSLYPDVHTILRLLLIAPVTSATVERSHSSLCFVKNVYRSTMGQ